MFEKNYTGAFTYKIYMNKNKNNKCNIPRDAFNILNVPVFLVDLDFRVREG